MRSGFIQLRRTSEAFELLRDRNAFALLTLIALRARRTDQFNIDELGPGQALLGDPQACGLTTQQYRSAKRRLQRWGLADFKPTPRGTIATLTSHAVYEINEVPAQHTGNRQSTRDPQAPNTRPTTNKNEKKRKNEKKTYADNSDELRLAQLLFDRIRERKEDFRTPDLQRWAAEIDRMIRLDRRTPERIEATLRWCQSDPFWQNNILSTAALRRHFDRLELRMGAETPRESTHDMIARMEREGKLE